MRRPLLALLAFCGLAFAPSQGPLPRGDENFQLGWNTFQVDSAVTARNAEILGRGRDFLTLASQRPEIEFVEYAFHPSPQGPGFLWKVTIAYRTPYTRDFYESVRGGLVGYLGVPAEERTPDPKADEWLAKVTWVDARTSVQLGARWREIQDPRADRMLVTWIDRKLQKVVEARRRNAAKQ